ncbi:MAG: NAD-dependent epimerase/dehydratase family protein [Pseudomonadota bacterium]
MKIMITGGAGFVGNHVIREALARGHEIVNIDALTFSASLSSIWEFEEDGRYAFEVCDIADGAALDEIFERHAPGGLIHLAGDMNESRAWEDARAAATTNAMGALSLLEATRRYQGAGGDFRFLFVSSGAVYGAGDGALARPDERRALAPQTPLSATITAAETLALTWARAYGLPVLAARGAASYGPWQAPSHPIPLTLARAVAGEPILVSGTGDGRCEWLHVQDHARALLDLLEHGDIGEAYNIASGAEMREIDLVRALCRQLQVQRPARLPYSRLITHRESLTPAFSSPPLDDAKLRTACGWAPQISLETGLAETVAWYLSHHGWWRPILDKAWHYQGGQIAAFPGAMEA